MATIAEVITDIRASIGDDDVTNLTYTDAQLTNVVQVGLRLLQVRAALGIVLSGGAFSPAPSDAQSSLISLQAQCIIANRQFVKAVDKGVKITGEDGLSVDTSAGLAGHSNLLNGKYGPCALLDSLVSEYLSGAGSTTSTATGAFSIWGGTTKLYEDVDFDGTGHDRLWQGGPGSMRSGRAGDNSNPRFNTGFE